MSQQSNSTLQSIAKHLVLAVEPLKRAVSNLNSFQSFMRRLGWHVQTLPSAYQALATQVDDAVNALQVLGEDPKPTEVLHVISQVEQVYHAIQNLTESPDGVDGPAFLAEIDERLFELLLIDALAANLPILYNLCRILNVIQSELHAATPTRPAFVRSSFHFSEIPQVLSDPLSIRERVYGWGAVDFDYDRVASDLLELFVALGFAATIEGVTPELSSGFLQTSDQDSGNAINYKVKIPILEVRTSEAPTIIGLAVLELPAEDLELPGIIVQPLVDSGLPTTDIQISEDVFLHVREGTDLSSQFGIVLRPGEFSVRYPFQPGSELPAEGFGISLAYQPDTTTLLLGSASATRLQFQGWLMRLDLDHDSAGFDLRLEFALEEFALVLSSGEQDSFIRKLLGDTETVIPVPLAIHWSNQSGFGFAGGSGFEVSATSHLQLGPVTIQSIRLGLCTTVESGHPPDLITQVGTSFGGQLGPLSFAVDNIGLRFVLTFAAGNAGPFDVGLGFKPPTGLSLTLDGGGFKGGGFLRFEPDHERYTGVLELEYQERIELKAIGLLTTRLPGGEPGFSLLIIISTSEFIPINLGLGFTLNGVGGLLGLNRTARVERLRTGLRDNTLRSILFPENLIANADRILSDLRQVFPPQDGRFLFGPMAKIGWGSPTLITVDLGLLIEIPQPVRVFILGVARALLPDEKAKLLQLQVNFLGEIDFERELFSFDASLYDSKLLTYTLSGDMAARLKWGDSDPNFLVTVGGFHPAYDPPPLGLPALRRLTVQLLKGNNPRLVLETYFAVTSNTAQFGARLELYAAAGKFNVYGFLSFDALFQFNPFYFIAEVGAMLALRVGSSSIASIQLALTLEGTTPWKARGTATLKLCWFIKIKVRFNKTFGEVRDTRLDDVAVLPLLRAALSDSGNWSAGIPSGRHLLVSVKEIEGLGDQVVAHPFGILEISQQVVPLNVEVQTFGNQRPADGNRFAIEQVRVGEPGDTETLGTSSVREQFAPAQYFEMTDAEKLSSKSFERYDAGVRVTASERLEAAYAAKRDVDYELFYIDSQRDQRLRPWFKPLRPEVVAFNAWASRGAVAASPLSFANTAKSALAPEAVQVSQEPFAVVNTSDLTLVRDDAVAFSEVGAFGLMRELIRSNPALEGEIQVVPAFEVNRS